MNSILHFVGDIIVALIARPVGMILAIPFAFAYVLVTPKEDVAIMVGHLSALLKAAEKQPGALLAE